jgi:hypothetical protein
MVSSPEMKYFGAMSKNVANTQFEDLYKATIELAKNCVIDDRTQIKQRRNGLEQTGISGLR